MNWNLSIFWELESLGIEIEIDEGKALIKKLKSSISLTEIVMKLLFHEKRFMKTF